MSFSSPWTLWENTREWVHEERKDEKKREICRSARRGSGKAFPVMNHLTFRITVEWWAQNSWPHDQYWFFCPHSVCECVCLCAGACEGLRRMKFLMFEFVERERDKWESRREERVWMIFFPLTSSGVRLCNWLVFLHLRVRVHCMRVCSSLHYNVCISLVLVTSVGG